MQRTEQEGEWDGMTGTTWDYMGAKLEVELESQRESRWDE